MRRGSVSRVNTEWVVDGEIIGGLLVQFKLRNVILPY